MGRICGGCDFWLSVSVCDVARLRFRNHLGRMACTLTSEAPLQKVAILELTECLWIPGLSNDFAGRSSRVPGSAVVGSTRPMFTSADQAFRPGPVIARAALIF
jgi:hypothetical protein